MFVGEIVGTAVLILLGDGVVAGVLLNRSKAQNGGWIVIALAWGMAVFTGVITSIACGGVAHLNPAVTIGLASIGATAWGDVPQLIAGQFIGAFIGAALVWASYLPHWAVTEDRGLKLAVFSTGPAIRDTVANLITEIVGTAMLVFGVAAIAIKLGGGFVVTGGAGMSVTGVLATGALPVGLLVLVIGLSLGGPTGYAINPARDLGPRIMHFVLPIAGKGDSDWEYSWIPVVGPIVGGVIGAFLADWAFNLSL